MSFRSQVRSVFRILHLSNLGREEQHNIIPNGCVFPCFRLLGFMLTPPSRGSYNLGRYVISKEDHRQAPE
jgi:hypothetical protein